jgi:hypothetical protein
MQYQVARRGGEKTHPRFIMMNEEVLVRRHMVEVVAEPIMAKMDLEPGVVTSDLSLAVEECSFRGHAPPIMLSSFQVPLKRPEQGTYVG